MAEQYITVRGWVSSVLRFVSKECISVRGWELLYSSWVREISSSWVRIAPKCVSKECKSVWVRNTWVSAQYINSWARVALQFVGEKYLTSCGRSKDFITVREWGMYFSSWVRNTLRFVCAEYITFVNEIVLKFLSKECITVCRWEIHHSSWVRNTLQFVGEKSFISSWVKIAVKFVGKECISVRGWETQYSSWVRNLWSSRVWMSYISGSWTRNVLKFVI